MSRERLTDADALVAAVEAGRRIEIVLVPRGGRGEGVSGDPAGDSPGDPSGDPSGDSPGRRNARVREAVERAAAAGAKVRPASARELERMADGSRGAAPALLALAGPDPACDLDGLLTRAGVVWLLAGVAYPGNAGFAIRTAEVSGAEGIVLDATFDARARKQALRASIRADRFFPVLWEDAQETLTAARARGLQCVGIEDTGDAAPWEVDLVRPSLLVVGGEARGLPPAVEAACDALVRIPMAGFIPSYNVQAAVAALAAERLRQLDRARAGGVHGEQ